ncbi:uncharacterized protein LOC119670371 [Teleopsis dalmanni]|uniref:uncharacterized protein LOC119670371 n=1 Tax=Teleopsis dalmanni TaxID=139649 RepID=UPI0018CDBB36|nr:uncharacterized protein LOC119670371 [Teleopsis dalmanni]
MFLKTGNAFLNIMRKRSTTVNAFKKLIDIHPQVQYSLDKCKPIVALESTIITHGMPFPQNFDTALEVEELVRANGAVPATIAIIDGRIKVGLNNTDLAKLAAKKQNEVIKCSRRDLPFVISQQKCGGTTVAATMIIAHMTGIKVFATGGVGGVHRDGHISMDISADLIELGRTPVAVICSGVKSILDIPRTLEYLETQGVCVAAYQNYGIFPDFYTRDSGCKAPYNLENPAEAAYLIKCLYDLDLNSGILIGVPIPEKYSANKGQITLAIEEAYKKAEQQDVNGKQVTPFLLEAISKITEGKSLNANMALIKNNATVGAQIAVELCKDNIYKDIYLQTEKMHKAPLIIGASILDLSLTMNDEIPTVLNGATYQIQTKQSAGGVGRNLAEGIFKLHGEANFISVVGNDELGKSLYKLIPKPLQQSVEIDNTNNTSLCSVIFDKSGDCKLILGNMDIHKSITPELVMQQEQVFQKAPLIIMDGNLSVQTMECVLELASKHQRPVFFEPTDMRIAAKPFTLPNDLTKQIKIISPNIFELKAIFETITNTDLVLEKDILQNKNLLLNITKDMLLKIQDNFDCVIVTLSEHGILLSLRGGHEKQLFDTNNFKYISNSDDKHSVCYYPAPVVQSVKNVSGAGDSFSSGFITGLLRGYKVEQCVILGFMAAERALQSYSAVPENYFANKNEESKIFLQTVKEIQKENI